MVVTTGEVQELRLVLKSKTELERCESIIEHATEAVRTLHPDIFRQCADVTTILDQAVTNSEDGKLLHPEELVDRDAAVVVLALHDTQVIGTNPESSPEEQVSHVIAASILSSAGVTAEHIETAQERLGVRHLLPIAA